MEKAGKTVWVDVFATSACSTGIVVYKSAQAASRALALNASCLHGMSIVVDTWVPCKDRPADLALLKDWEPSFPPLRTRVAAADLATFDFLLGVNAFSSREVSGDSFLQDDHLELCLAVGRAMLVENKASPLEFQELLAASFIDCNPRYVYLKRRLDAPPGCMKMAMGKDAVPLSSPEPCHLDTRDFLSFHQEAQLGQSAQDGEGAWRISWTSALTAVATWFCDWAHALTIP
jgi:hypothetical protein